MGHFDVGSLVGTAYPCRKHFFSFGMRERPVSDEEVGVTKGFAVQACFYIIVVYGESIEEYLFVVLFQVFKNSPILFWT